MGSFDLGSRIPKFWKSTMLLPLPLVEGKTMPSLLSSLTIFSLANGWDFTILANSPPVQSAKSPPVTLYSMACTADCFLGSLLFISLNWSSSCAAISARISSDVTFRLSRFVSKTVVSVLDPTIELIVASEINILDLTNSPFEFTVLSV